MFQANLQTEIHNGKVPILKAATLPLIFAHRGANSFAPENSLPAFEHALRMGCDGIELDLRFSASGEVVIFHDRLMQRMTGKPGRVELCDLAEIRKRQLNGAKGVGIPILQEVLDLIGERLLINLDIKKGTVNANGFEEKIVRILRDFKLRENIIISSFNPLVVRRIYALAPELRLGFIYQKRSHRIFSAGIPLESLHGFYKILCEKYVRKLQGRGYRIYAWTVDNPDDMRRMMSLGVDGIITNRPEIFYEKIASGDTENSQ